MGSAWCVLSLNPLATKTHRSLGSIAATLSSACPGSIQPAEHGAQQVLRHLTRKVWRNVTWTCWPPRRELAEADGIRAFFGVINHYRRRETLGLDEQPDLASLRVADGVVHVPTGRRTEVRAVYRVPTINLETASAETRRGARARWGGVLNALPHPIQIVIPAGPLPRCPSSSASSATAAGRPRTSRLWLGAHLHGAQLVERERYLVVPADDLELLADRCSSLEASMRRIGLPMERISGGEDLRNALSGFLTPRPRQFGPAVVDVGAADRLTVDGEHVRSFDLGKLPPTIVTDWMNALLDGDLPVDVSLDIAPLDLSWAKVQPRHPQERAGEQPCHARAIGGAGADRRPAHGLRAPQDAADAAHLHRGGARTGPATLERRTSDCVSA